MTGHIARAPIGIVRGGRTEIFEDHWGPVESRLLLDPAVLDPDATAGLSEFSHIEVVFPLPPRDQSPARRIASTRQPPPGRRSAYWLAIPRSGRITSASPAANCSR